MPRAIALLSGGLDSTLAVLLLRRQGIEVTALTFLTHFGCDISDSSSCSADSSSNAARYGFQVKLCHLAEKFIEIVKHPKHGHGKNMNPCIDCRILMLREAAELMRMTGADFLATGEVVGQRPMSQMRNTLNLIDKESGVRGRVLRPLSAKLLPPTVPEERGLVDRGRLMDFSGRSRKPQMAMANDFGLSEYPAPAGGCLLTDPNYSHKLKDLLKNEPDPGLRDFHLLRLGRHFRLPGGSKAVVGRHEAENGRLEALAGPDDCLLTVEGAGSPVTLVPASSSEDDIALAATLCARYSDAKDDPSVMVSVRCAGTSYGLPVTPAARSLPDSLRVHPN